MATRRSSKIQKNVLAHANARRAIQLMMDESNTNNLCHLSSLTFAYASAAICNIASSPALCIPAKDYQIVLRHHLQLPSLMAPLHDTPTHVLARQQEITTAAHDAIRDALLESASLADHYIKAEPSDLYPNPIANTRVDGVVEPAPEAQAALQSSATGRVAFDVFTSSDPDRVQAIITLKNAKHSSNVEAAGDTFVAAPFTPAGTPYPQALQLMRRLAHTGDKLAPSAGRDAPRFHHECTQSTFITPTHTAYTAHACAAAAARATAKAMRKYAHKRAIGSALAKLVHNQPRVVDAPL